MASKHFVKFNWASSFVLFLLIRLPFSRKWRWKLRWKPLDVHSSYSVPSCLRAEIKNSDKGRSSSLAGMFSIVLNSFIDSQNFFLAFKSLLVLYWEFLDFCACKIFSISTSSLLVAFSAGLKFATFAHCLYLLPSSGLLVLPFSTVLTGTSQFFLLLLFVTFWGQMLH